MAVNNILALSTIAARESAAILENSLTFTKYMDRSWEKEFRNVRDQGYEPGQTILIKKPPRYFYRNGLQAMPQATNLQTVPLTVNPGGVDLQFGPIDLTLGLNGIEKPLAAATATVANTIDRNNLAMASLATFNAIGTPGTAPTTQAAALALLTAGQQRLQEMGAPVDGEITLITSPSMNASLVQGTTGLFAARTEITKQYLSARFVEGLGLRAAWDQNTFRQTFGTCVTGTNIVGAGQTGNSLTVAAISGTITRGTIITLPGINFVNPQNRSDTGALAQFVVTADVVTGSTSIPISPSITPSGAFQNVTASPTNALPFAFWGAPAVGQPVPSYNVNIMYHRDAFTFAMVPFVRTTPGSGVIEYTERKSEFPIRVMTGTLIGDASTVWRLDQLSGAAAVYPELAVRIVGL